MKQPNEEQTREWAMRRRIAELEAELDRAYQAMTRLRACPCMIGGER